MYPGIISVGKLVTVNKFAIKAFSCSPGDDDCGCEGGEGSCECGYDPES